MSSTWRKVDAGGPGQRERRHTVYWYRRLDDGRRLTVGRVYEPDGTWKPGGSWCCKVYPAGYRGPMDSMLVDDHGHVSTVQQGRRKLDRLAGAVLS